MKKTKVTTETGIKICLCTDDTFTLAIGPEMIETTPASLSAIVSRKDLIHIINHSTDSAEVYKASKALAL